MDRFIPRMVSIAMGGTFAVSVSAQSPHEHGTANLNIAVDSNDILLEFISPAVNIIGFEHMPNNTGQQRVLNNAVAFPTTLSAVDPTMFIQFPGLEKIDVQLIGASGQHGAELTPEQPRLTL